MDSSVTSFVPRMVACVAVVLVAGFACSAGELTRELVWSTPIKGGVGSSPVPYPSAAAGAPAAAADSVVVTGGANQVVRLDAKGRMMFEYDLGDSIGAVPAVGDVDGDGEVEIVAGTVRGHIVCLTGDGELKWSQEVRQRFEGYACVVLAPRLTGAGCDVLLNSPDGWLTCLGPRGEHRWVFRVAEPGNISPPAAADLNGDGRNEYVCGIDAERIIAITDDGHLWWEFAEPENFGRCHAVIADADRDGKPEVFMLKNAADSTLHCLDAATGRLLWAAPIAAKSFCPVSVTDINDDGYDEILVGTKYNQLLAFTHTGEQMWMQTMGGNGIFWSSAVADIDGDGALEIVVGIRQSALDGSSLCVLNTRGDLLGAYPQEGEANVAAMVADLDRDGLLEVISCSRDKVFAYHFGNPAKGGRVLWPCYRGNSYLNGNVLPARAAKGAGPSQPRALRRAQGKLAVLHDRGASAGRLLPETFEPILGDTPVEATWATPTPAQGYVEVTLTAPRGIRLTQAFRTSPDKRSVEVLLPFRHAGRYAIEARLLDTEQSRTLMADTRQVAFEPLAAERRMVEAALASIPPASPAMAASAPQLAAELERRRAGLSAMLATLRARVESIPADEDFPQTVLDAAAKLRAQVGRELAFAEFARKVAATAPETAFVVWPDANPWDNADPRDELPGTVVGAQQAAPLPTSAWTYGNQREDFCLNLVSLGPEPFSVRVEPADLTGPDGAKAPWQDHLTLLQVVWMPTRFGGEIPDMLPAMNPGRTVQLAPGGFAQVWLVVDTKDLAPGEWHLNLRFQSLTHSAASADATLSLDVLPVALPYPYPWKLCNWAWPTAFPQPLRDRVIESLISHGSNVLYAPAPSRACDEQGNLVGEVDWSQLDELVAKAKAGDPFLFFTSLPLNAPPGVAQDSDAWKKAFKAWMGEFVAHLASIGIGYRDFAFYPVDEPGNSGHTGIEQLIAAAKVLREADPQAPIYADPAGGAYPTEWIRELDPWVDVWAPASGLSSRADIREIISTRSRRTGRSRHVWMYDAVGNVRALSPLDFYRRQPWVALRNGARGSGFWVYSYSNLWGMGTANEPDYGTVAIDRTDVVESRRWRATHDGIQDVTAVVLLDDAIANAEKSGVAGALVEKAKAARAAAVAAMAPESDYEAELPLQVLQRSRRQVADALLMLRDAIAAKE